ncbi:MAG: SpoIIE family protein phosphatase [Oligoflexia bacterium]|nr:SpoIIE family protein phosphatase [Oligoflexia bacterium]
MGQLLFRKSFSVGTKLLLSVLLLVAVVIGFLNVSAILLLQEDKQAYVFQSKLTEAVLAGSEFVNTSRHAIDTLRLSLATVDPRNPVVPQQQSALETVIANQNDVLHVAIGFIEPQVVTRSAIAMNLVASASKAKKLEELQAKAEDFALSQERIQAALPELQKNGLAFLNLSRDGVPLLGIVAAEGAASGSLPVAFGVVPLRSFGAELSALNLTIATRSGWVLFDTDPTAMYSVSNIKEDPLYLFATGSAAANGTHEYVSRAGVRFLGSYVFPGYDLVAFTRVEWAKANRTTYALTEKFVLLGAIAIGIAVLFAIFFAKTLTAPIAKLYQATKVVGEGRFDLALEVSSDDEIGELTRSFNTMSSKINELFIESVEKVKLENELDIASTVQQNLLPPPVYTDERVEIHSYYQAASRCGGDWWGTFSVRDKVIVGIADATGHGLPCALITASAKSTFTFLHQMAEGNPHFPLEPGAMLTIANRVIHDATGGRIMMTFFVAVLDFSKGRLRYANAGHNPPWLFREDKGKVVLKSLTAAGPRLGETRDLAAIEEKSAELRPGDLILMYTDGLMEGKGATGEMYGKRRMRGVVERHFADGPRKVVDGMVGDFSKHGEGVTQEDDVTIAAIKVLGPGGGPSGALQA